MTGKLTISMFDVGFGDCFLVAIPTANGTCRILFDCGRHKGGDVANQALADAVIAAARDSDGVARIDLVVATHRHKDHVSGFKMKGWDNVEVREVWMPWTEDPDDPNARGVVNRQVRAAAAALQAFAITAPTLAAADRARYDQMASLVGLALSNEAAMDTLYSGFGGSAQRRFLPDPHTPLAPLSIASAPGVRFHVMGPPRAEATMGIMDPPKAETFKRLALAMAGDDSADSAVAAFGANWVLGAAPNDLFSAADQQALHDLAESAGLIGLSAAIDNAINNTSLVVMIEVGSAFLLFCADAQWGNWQTILAEPQWCDLIRKTTFLKVGHHASHNASPVTLIDKLLPDGIAAMVSVEEGAYSNVPFGGLLDAFSAHNYKTARSDQSAVEAGFVAQGYGTGVGIITTEIDF